MSPNTAKPRVLFLVTEDWYFCLHRLSLAKAVRDSGYEVIVATHVADEGDRISREGFKLIPIRLSRSSLNPFAELMAIAELVRIYRREKPDILHHVALKPILYGSWAAWIAGRELIVNAFAGLGYIFTATSRLAQMARGAVVLMLRSAFAVTSAFAIFENGDDFEVLRSCAVVSRERSVVIRGSGVDEHLFHPVAEPPGNPVVLLAGRMLLDKGIAEFVRASELIRSRGIQARFVLAGRRDPSNPSSVSEEQLRRWQAEGLVEWWGQCDDMADVIGRSHIAALPSYREGLPRFLLEAAASGRPVVATDVPGCREIVRHGENGFLVPARNPAALAESVIELLENPGLRRRMGECGRNIILRSFTETHVFSQVLELYSGLLKKSGGLNTPMFARAQGHAETRGNEQTKRAAASLTASAPLESDVEEAAAGGLRQYGGSMSVRSGPKAYRPAPDLNGRVTTPLRKHKLLFLVTEDWYFYGHRLNLARAARDSGYEVIVATRVTDHGARIRAEGFKLVPIRLLRTTRNPFADLLAIAELVRIYRTERPDIIHHVAMKPVLYGSWAARITRQRVIVNGFPGLGFVFTGAKPSTRITRSAVSLLLKSAFRNSASIAMCQNPDDYEALLSRGVVNPRNAVIIRGSGVDEKEFLPVPEAPGNPVVLLAARMLRDKGIGEFVEAAALIRRRGIRARFVLAGRRDTDNPSSISEEQLQEWQAQGLVEWWGNRDDMPSVMAMSHIVALPSYREGLPKSLLEAASCMRPIVATDVPGCREIVRNGENGFLVPDRDAVALAEALIKLIQSPDLRRRMGERGRQLVVEGFTTMHVTKRVLDVYSDLLRETSTKDRA